MSGALYLYIQMEHCEKTLSSLIEDGLPSRPEQVCSAHASGLSSLGWRCPCVLLSLCSRLSCTRTPRLCVLYVHAVSDGKSRWVRYSSAQPRLRSLRGVFFSVWMSPLFLSVQRVFVSKSTPVLCRNMHPHAHPHAHILPRPHHAPAGLARLPPDCRRAVPHPREGCVPHSSFSHSSSSPTGLSLYSRPLRLCSPE